MRIWHYVFYLQVFLCLLLSYIYVGHLSLASNRDYRYLEAIFRNDIRYFHFDRLSNCFSNRQRFHHQNITISQTIFMVVMILPVLSLQSMLVAVDKSLVDNESPFFLEAFLFHLHHSAGGKSICFWYSLRCYSSSGALYSCLDLEC